MYQYYVSFKIINFLILSVKKPILLLFLKFSLNFLPPLKMVAATAFLFSFPNILLYLPRCIIKYLPLQRESRYFIYFQFFAEFHYLISLLFYAFSLEGKASGKHECSRHGKTECGRASSSHPVVFICQVIAHSGERYGDTSELCPVFHT